MAKNLQPARALIAFGHGGSVAKPTTWSNHNSLRTADKALDRVVPLFPHSPGNNSINFIKMVTLRHSVFGLLWLMAGVTAFTPNVGLHRTSSTSLYSSWEGEGGGAGPSNGNVGNIERIEFKIFPDGRVEETVRGVKGGNCHKVTDKINEQLGKVLDSAPTEEMYEQDLTIDQTLTQSDGWEGSTPTSW